MLRQNANDDVKIAKNAIEGIKAEEEGITKEKMLQLEILQKQEEEALKEKERQKQISTIVSGISTLTSVISSSQGLFNTWFGDNDLSTFDKVTQSLTVMAATIPILINGWSNLKNLLPALTAQMGLYNTVEEAGIAIKNQGILLTLKDIAVKGLHVFWTKMQVLWQTILNIVTGQWDKVGALATVAIAAIVAGLGIWIYK